MSLAATASAGTVNWYTSATGGSAFTSGSSFDTPELTETTVYYVDATVGSCTTGSRTAVTATVTPAASGGVISGDTTVCAGTNSTVLTVSGTVGTVVWESSADGVNYSVVAGATGTTLTVTNLSVATYYRVVATGGCNSAISEAVLMSVSSVPVAGTLSGGGSVCTGGAPAALELSGHVGSISWYTSADNVTFALSEYTTPDAFFLPVDIQETVYVKAVVSADGCTPVESNVQAITVTTAPVVGSITGQAAVCAPTNSLTLTVEDYTGSIQWQRSSDDETFTNISGATAATYTATNTTANTYYRVVTTIGSCTATSYSALVEVTPSAVAGSVSGAATVCTGSNNTELSLSGYTGSIQWQSSSNNSTFTDISSQTESVYYVTDITATTY
jgi:hypothetical protein